MRNYFIGLALIFGSSFVCIGSASAFIFRKEIAEAYKEWKASKNVH